MTQRNYSGIKTCKVIFLLTVVFIAFSSLNVYSQTGQERYLLYAKQVRRTFNPNPKQPQFDTVFVLFDVLWKQKSNWFSQSLLVYDYPEKEHVKVKREGNTFHINSYDAILLEDSLFNAPPSVQYVLVPIGQGIKVKPFKDQLIWGSKDLGRKILFEAHPLNHRLKNYQTKSSAINYSLSTGTLFQRERITYFNEDESNLINLTGITGTVLQVISITDSTVNAKEYSFMPRKGDAVVSYSSLKRRPYPDSATVKKVTERLEGHWTSINVSRAIFNGMEPVSCTYNFQFQKGEIIVTKNLENAVLVMPVDFMNPAVTENVRFKSKTDTLDYKLNPSADYFVVDKSKSEGRISYMIIENLEDTKLVLSLEDRWPTADGTTNRRQYLRIELRKK